MALLVSSALFPWTVRCFQDEYIGFRRVHGYLNNIREEAYEEYDYSENYALSLARYPKQVRDSTSEEDGADKCCYHGADKIDAVLGNVRALCLVVCIRYSRVLLRIVSSASP